MPPPKKRCAHCLQTGQLECSHCLCNGCKYCLFIGFQKFAELGLCGHPRERGGSLRCRSCRRFKNQAPGEGVSRPVAPRLARLARARAPLTRAPFPFSALSRALAFRPGAAADGRGRGRGRGGRGAVPRRRAAAAGPRAGGGGRAHPAERLARR